MNHLRRAAIRRRAFTFVEMMVVAAVLAVFATVVIPQLASADRPSAESLRSLLEADLRRARTEALARAMPVSLVVAADGSGWWLADGASPASAMTGTRRTFGRGALSANPETRLLVQPTVDGDPPSAGTSQGAVADAAIRVLASFDALGSRDDAAPQVELRHGGERLARWTLPAGRSRFEHERIGRLLGRDPA